MRGFKSLDALVQTRLEQWPQRPPGLPSRPSSDAWLRGRPTETLCGALPFLKFPGSDRLRTLPDGLWLNFGGTPAEPFVDIFAVEACGSMQNLLDKRSRFAPSTQSLMAVCPVEWLLGAITFSDPTPRWNVTGVLLAPPTTPLVLPVRDIRVLYGLKAHHYEGFVESQLPHPHEYFVPMDALTNADGCNNPALRTLVGRASATANFLTDPSNTITPESRPERRAKPAPAPTTGAGIKRFLNVLCGIAMA